MDSRSFCRVGGALLGVFALAIALPRLLADDGHGDRFGGATASHSFTASSGHGGQVVMTKEFHFEVAFHTDGVHVFAYDHEQKRISSKGMTGTVRVEFVDQARKAAQADLDYVVAREVPPPGDGEAPFDCLHASLDLSKLGEAEATATFELSGLPSRTESSAKFTQPFKMARIVEFVCEACSVVSILTGTCTKCSSPFVLKRSYFGCPMHPEVASDRDGDICWKCGGMKLVNTVEGAAGGDHGEHECECGDACKCEHCLGTTDDGCHCPPKK